MLKRILIILICFCSLNTYSQDSLADTISLREIVCKDIKTHKYSVGTIIHSIDTLSKDAYDYGNLSDLLSNTTAVYINKRSDGFSTISLRGSSANHTAILVDGINLNSLTLGHSNLANIDMFLFDNADIQLGSSGALYGSDAIGGTINLKLDKTFTKGTKVIIKSNYSSLHNFFEGVKIFTGTDKFESKTRLYYLNNLNHFKFVNHGTTLFGDNGISFPTEYTNNARKENYGFLQQFFFKPSLENTFNLMLWYQKNWNEIQPSMGNNSQKGTYEVSKDEYIRVLGGYERLGTSYKLKTNIGYVKDKQVHNRNEKEYISTERFISNSSLDYSISKDKALSLGIDYKYIKPTVYTYPEGLTEHRTEAFILFKHELLKDFKYSVNLRQSFVSGYKSPFTPAIALSYSLVDKESTKSYLSLNLSKGYKIPTLNQRFWGSQGNRNIKPEESLSAEIGYTLRKTIKQTEFSLNLNTYYSQIDNWIMWVNKGEWVPINERKVDCSGAEVFSSIAFELGEMKLKYSLNYFFTSSLLKESDTEINNVGKQLAYTPRHMLNTDIILSLKNYILRTDMCYTGERYVDAYNSKLKDYYIFNSSLSKSFEFNKTEIKLAFAINNFFDKDYQTTEYYAMPGRNYNISLNIKIN